MAGETCRPSCADRCAAKIRLSWSSDWGGGDPPPGWLTAGLGFSQGRMGLLGWEVGQLGLLALVELGAL